MSKGETQKDYLVMLSQYAVLPYVLDSADISTLSYRHWTSLYSTVLYTSQDTHSYSSNKQHKQQTPYKVLTLSYLCFCWQIKIIKKS